MLRSTVRGTLAAIIVTMPLRGPRGCVTPPELETLIAERTAEAGLSGLSTRGHIVLEDADDCVTLDERVRGRLFENTVRSCSPGRLDVWENKAGGMAHVVALVLPEPGGGCAVELFSDNTRVPGERPTSIHYAVTDVVEYSECRGVGFRTRELGWWHLQPDGILVPEAPEEPEAALLVPATASE